MKPPRPPKGQRWGGRKKGTLNKATVAQQEFLDAWSKKAGPKTAEKLVLKAVERALGFEVIEKTYEHIPDPKDPTKRVRVLAKEKVWQECNVDTLNALLPYIAQKLPAKTELTGAGGKPLIPPGAGAAPIIDVSKLSETQIDALIAATAARAEAPK